jgi:hypothetical protein
MKSIHPVEFSSLRHIVAVLSTVMFFGICTRSIAQTPTLEVYYDRLDPKATFNYKWKGQERVCNVGAFRWEIPPSEFGTGGLDRNFTGYCADINVHILAEKLYRFRPISLLEPRMFGLEDDAEGIRAAERRATLIRELFGRYYSQSKTSHPDETFAFQVAIWELTHETEPMDRAVTFDLFSGDFQANYPKEQAPAFVLLAQAYLDSLTGNDSIYYENQDLKGRELILLEGIPNADGVVAQSQYALRYINGGAPGVGSFANTLGNGAPGGAFGGLGSGIGAGLGAGTGVGEGGVPDSGGPLIAAGGGVPSTSTPIPAGSPPPTGGQSRVPGGGPTTTTTSTTPVPSPAGLILGLVAVGALATRRVYTRFLQK